MRKIVLISIAVLTIVLIGCVSNRLAVNHPTICHIDYAALDKYASDYVKRTNNAVVTTYEISQWRCVKCGRGYFATNAVSFR